MNAPRPLLRLLQAARRRRFGSVLLLAAAPWLVTSWALPRTPLMLLASIALLLTIVIIGLQRARRLQAAWLARQLDAKVPGLEDSSALLLGLEPPASTLAEAQSERLRDRLAQLQLPDLREPWPWRGALLSLALSLLALALLAFPRAPQSLPPDRPGEPPASVDQAQPARIDAVELRITPPAYTDLPEQRWQRLDGELAAGSALQWSLRLSGRPSAVALVFHDGQRLDLQAGADGLWQAGRTLDGDTYYRVETAEGLRLEGPEPADAGPWRLRVIEDQPPQLKLIEPERTLSIAEPDQRRWTLRLEASDDYALGPAELQITLAQGSGEQITVSEQRLRLDGQGDARQRVYRRELDLGALGFVEGSDLILRASVSDRAQPRPQTSVSASYILRWPARRGAEASGVEISVQKAMPAYFRSQRQLIIDTEALIAERPQLTADDHAGRSDALGVDQRILRLRYGQFLGEEAEGAPSAEMQARVAALSNAAGEHDDDDDHAHGQGADHDEHADDGSEAGHDPNAPGDHSGHDHAQPARFGEEGERFGSAVAILDEYGHVHDTAEATTLFDPATRRLLRSALNEMWSAELALRQAEPRQSLPHQYRALEYIKQVQQASRIYLSRVGLELPPIDLSRRLQAEAKDLARPRDPLSARASSGQITVAERWWSTLEAGSAPDPEQLAELRAWLAEQGGALDDPLALLEAAERWSSEPACSDCAAALRRQLWPLLPTALAAPRSRPAVDAAGAAYLRQLSAPGSDGGAE
jgi:hypothetical protein